MLEKDRVKELREREMKKLSGEEKKTAEVKATVAEKLEALPEGSLDDPFIREMERSLAQGDNASVKEMLKSFKM